MTNPAHVGPAFQIGIHGQIEAAGTDAECKKGVGGGEGHTAGKRNSTFSLLVLFKRKIHRNSL